MSSDNRKGPGESSAGCDASVAAAVTLKEIEALKQTILEKETHILAMERVYLTESERQAELEDSLIAWQDKYERLYESHKRVQKVNQGLEDKLLKLVDRNTGERAQLTSDVATLSLRLAQANFNITKLQRDIERYKADINLAIQLLQCKPDGFMPQKISSLPIEIQCKVSSYMRLDSNSQSDSDSSMTGVEVPGTTYKVLPASDSPPREQCPFPPTAMVYSMRGLDANRKSESATSLSNNILADNSNTNGDAANNNTGSCHTGAAGPPLGATGTHDMLSPTAVAKYLEDELKVGEVKHCGTCRCSKDLTVIADVSRSYAVATQTPSLFVDSFSGDMNDSSSQLCLRCYSNLNSPSRANSPYTKGRHAKSSDSVLSRSKSSGSDLNEIDKLLVPAKKDDLTVNPILGHRRPSERAALPAGCSGLTFGRAPFNALLDNTRNNTSYHRRFVDGGGTALHLLEDKSHTRGLWGQLGDSDNANTNANDLDVVEREEEKPLLAATATATAAAAAPFYGELQPLSKGRTASSLELGGDSREQARSPTASTRSALEPSKLSSSAVVTHNMAGSATSVASTSSSCEGAKIFETFNRNLIKTMRAENPKHRGPRLCAMRIQQNGHSNILLDNMESVETVTTVVYRRRERLLDEELYDGKEVITSETSPADARQLAVETAKEAAEFEAVQFHFEPSDAETTRDPEAKDRRLDIGLGPSANKTDCGLPDCNEDGKQALCQSVAAYGGGCDNSGKPKSSPGSENAELQESMFLRRQQLSRVAEWVQNNTKQMERVQQQQQQQAQHLSVRIHSDSSDAGQQMPFTALDQLDSVSVAKLSMDSGYKTTQQCQPVVTSSPEETVKTSVDSYSPKSEPINDSRPNFTPDGAQSGGAFTESPVRSHTSHQSSHAHSTAQTFYRRTSRSGLPVAQASAEAQDSSSQCSQIVPEQPTCDIVNYQFYPNESSGASGRVQQSQSTAVSQPVDIAQMEYNVKQFLLKQNEWSMPTTASRTNGNKRPVTRSIKLLASNSCVGIGPGRGERVLNASAIDLMAPIGAGLPVLSSNGQAFQRTETNL